MKDCKTNRPNIDDKDRLADMLESNTEAIANEALRRYFITLSQYGYYDYTSVYRLLALVMLSEFRSEFIAYWTKRDERAIQRLLECLYCSICAIPSPTYVTNTEVNGNRKDYAK